MVDLWIALAALRVAFGVFAFCVVHMLAALRRDLDDLLILRLRDGGLGEREEKDFK